MTHRPLMPRLDLRRFRWHRSLLRGGTCFVRDMLEDQIADWVADWVQERQEEAC